ncbi:MAG TPA: adenylate/guanylate cyclase domain-containing protein [Planktothrix sp. UBA8407]|jgi:Predicted transmembrane sensor domain|nr:adenylate/guanylate cyclase domain-containing protein [Planktothrix sp. UBA8402]HAO11649.1 adenylate/guanylate cyclase domain-containing protein [Planktothrix sp. UBA8407]HBK24799.1 adenylate/guanylate cyclase domain-containing protein [Planktothrix sp. UBA10369]
MIVRILRINKFNKNWLDLSEIYAVIIATILVLSLLLGIYYLGWLQPLELVAYDQMVRLRPALEADPRLVVIGITDEDIQAFNRWPLSDEVIARLLEKLSKYKPKVIGLDLYRDIRFEPGYDKFQKQLQISDHIIVINNLGYSETKGTPAPPNVPDERVGFNDLLLDPDNIIRRNLMFANTADTTFYSFSLRIALHYLLAQGIKPNNSPVNPNFINWGKAEFVPLSRNSGGYQTIDDQGYQILLNYRSANNIAKTISLTKFLYGTIPENWIKDKIVLIGMVAISTKDLFLTPYSPTEKKAFKMPGVLVHAQMVSQILDAVLGQRNLFIFWEQWGEFLWICSWGLIGATLAWSSRNPLIITLGNPFLVGVLFGLSFFLFLHNRWVPTTTPGLALLFTSGTVTGHRAFQAQRQQQIVMRLLGQNTSPEIANALWNSRDRLLADGKLPGQKLIATILFSDIKNFSTISEEMPPEILMEWLNEYLSVLTQCVQTHHGIINKFTGDGIMAAFGVPLPRRTQEAIAKDAYNAVACALAIEDKLKQLNQDWKNRNFPEISMRIGIFTGPIVAGSLGGKERLEYGLLGDSVNIASRLESCEKDRQPGICRILIAYQTLQYIADSFEVESWGLIPLKGRHEMVDIYLVIGWKKTPNQGTGNRE